MVTLTEFKDQAYSNAFSSEGALWAIGGSRELRVVSSSTGQTQNKFDIEEVILSIAFHQQNSELLVTGDYGGAITIWCLKQSLLLKKIQAYDGGRI